MSRKLTYAHDEADLAKVVAFLEGGFDWGKDHSARVIARLSQNPEGVPKAAYLEGEDGIKIALLLFSQAEAVINLSSWYAVADFRGLFSVNFARMLVRDLEGFCLTNYTPSREAYAVFKAMGFAEMKVHHRRLGVTKRFPFFTALEGLAVEGTKRKISFAPLGEAQEGQVSYRMQVVKKSFLRLRTMDYYLDRAGAKGVSFWPLLRFALRKLCVQVNVFTESAEPIKDARWLVKDGQTKGGFVFPAGSELCVHARR